MHDAVMLARRANIMPEMTVIQGTPGTPVVSARGRDVLLFCSSNYLGLGDHPEVREAVVSAVATHGVGANGSRLISGTTDLHVKLEKATAAYKGTEAAIAFPTGYMAATGTIAAFAHFPHFARMCGVPLGDGTHSTVILSDALNHASIVDGCRSARAETVYYNHCDVDMLAEKLYAHRGKRLLIVTDGVFSMDGDIAPLPEILYLADRYDAEVLLDDAHAGGVLGPTGRGTLEHFGLDAPPNLMQMGTYSKSFGCVGGFVATDALVAEYLSFGARPYMFSGSLPPCMAAGITKALEIAEREPERRERLWANRDYLVRHLTALGFDTLGSKTPIVPIFIGDDAKATTISERLFGRGLLAPSVKWPAVAAGQSRIRITLMASHEREHLDRLLEGLAELGKEYAVI